ncbi:MAG: amidohydrolase family protein, partial [Verrucomicrobiota bacterium]
VKDREARLEAGNLAGSTLRFNEGLKNIAEITGLPLNQLVSTTAANQARSLGLSDRGKLEAGLLADVVLLDDDFEVKAVFVGGEQKF